MNNCGHETGYWIRGWYDDWNEYQHPDEYVTKTTYDDIDLHRARCRLCGHVLYYSKRAEEHYAHTNKELTL